MRWLFVGILSALAVSVCNCGYLITFPRRWMENSQSQICASLTEGTFLETDSLIYSLTELKQEAVLVRDEELKFPAGKTSHCVDVNVPPTEDNRVTISLAGTLANEEVSDSFNLTFADSRGRTFIQTDKYLYRQGQKVQFRILTAKGPNGDIDTTNYKEIYVLNPSRTRIAQWLDVDNTGGLVHLSLDLYDEADEGTYSIYVQFSDGKSESKRFKVEEYVLPKYEVTIKPTNTILGNDESVTIEMCARYTFGEPVRGNGTLSLAAGTWKIYANLTENKQVNGCMNATFPTDKLYFEQNNCHIRISTLKARGVVVEDGTEVEISGENNDIKVHRSALRFIDEKLGLKNKPYLPVVSKVRVEHVNGTSAVNEPMELCTYYKTENICKNTTTDGEGYIIFVVPSSASSRIEIKALNYPKIERNWNEVMRQDSHSKYIDRPSFRNQAATNASLTIDIEGKLKCVTGQEQIISNLSVIYVAEPQTGADIHVQVMSRGQVVSHEIFKEDLTGSELPIKNLLHLIPLDNLPGNLVRGSFDIPLRLPISASPRIKVLIWYTAGEEMIAETRDIDVTECLAHEVDFKWSKEKVEPGQEANLILKGAENALCSLGVVDKSVELLSTGNNGLSARDILNLAVGSETGRWDEDQLTPAYCHGKYNFSDVSEGDQNLDNNRFYDYRSENDAFRTLVLAGYFVSTNLGIDKHFCDLTFIQELKNFHRDRIHAPEHLLAFERQPPGGNLGHRIKVHAVPASVSFQSNNRITESEYTSVEKVDIVEEVTERNYLPETWLWLLTPLSATGELNEPYSLPHTITEWVGKAVCVHPTKGVGISGKSSITTFTPFFVDLTLPATATRGEVLPIKISTFNYLDEPIPVKVTVEPSEDYEFVQGESGVRNLCIKPQTKGFETIKVNLTKIGDVNLTVEAVTDPLASEPCGSGAPPAKKDRLVRSLPVEPEGYLREKTLTKYVCSEDLENLEGPVDTWKLETPEVIVPDSERAWILAIGDLMGPTIENLGRLVRFPSGCGEQNMVNFAPNIYIMQYLETSGQNTDALRSKITKFLNSGYQRQLRFVHKNSSYSAFGTKDREGSTWLTAFVVKSFAQARPYTQIDEESLANSAEWLKNIQNPEGCFESYGRVLHKGLQGGIGTSGKSEALLTAYVLAALIEQGNVTEEIINSAIECIKTDTSEHPYSLALKAYAFTLAKSPEAAATIDKLLASAASNSSVLRWELPDREGQHTSLHIETAAYALLALVTENPALYSTDIRKLVRWISGRRNGQGGFVSTQDTVVALQALAAFEKVEPRKPLDMNIEATAPGTTHSFNVNDANKFLQQRVDVPSLPSTFDLTMNGGGCVLVQGVVRYNVLGDTEGPAFTLSNEVLPVEGEGCNTNNITVCASYNLADGASNMAIIEVKLVSGFVPLKQDLKAVVADNDSTFKRYEVDGRKVIFYLDEITAEQTCLSFRAYQDIQLEGAKPGSVTVYDYYQPEYISTQKFKLESVECKQ